MDQKKTMALVVGIAAVVILFAVVYSQFRTKDAATPAPAIPTGDQPWRDRDMKADAVPAAEPETPEDIAAAIDAQLAEDAKALDAEVAAENEDIEDELKSLDELNDAYDENAY